MKPPFFVFDVESIGLHGEGFAVAGGILLPDNDQLLDEFCFACPSKKADGTKNDRAWIETNLPAIATTHINPIAVMRAFWSHWEDAQKKHPGITMAAECGWPVEHRFLEACVGLEEEICQGPYPLHEIASFMLIARMDPMATYERLPNESPKHHPLADARQSARLLSEAWDKIHLTMTAP